MTMWNRTSIACMSGMALASVGILLRMYIIVRVAGVAGFFRGASSKGLSDLTKEYSSLVDRGEAPSWMPKLSFSLIGLGVLIAFGSVLILR